jgi:hypothetical protein
MLRTILVLICCGGKGFRKNHAANEVFIYALPRALFCDADEL